MTKRNKLYVAGLLFIMFIGWTFLVARTDVQAVGPLGSEVGLATVNGYFRKLIGVNFRLYHLTDVLSFIPVAFMAVFAVIGFLQFIRKRSICKVDRDLLYLAGFYSVIALAYILFEVFPVNYRPVLIDNTLEASYPSSTTLMVISVMLTAVTVLKRRVKSARVMKFLALTIEVFTFLMVFGRAISGVHWLSDIIGGILLSWSLVCLYNAISE